MSDIRHLKCLSGVRSMKGVHQLTAAAFPGVHCPMHTALSLAVKIRGISTLVIGTAECGYYSRNVSLSSPYGDEAFHWNYLLDSNEVVFGFRKGLIEAIKEMDRAGAKVILLLITCVPELVGEDIESICYELEPRINAKLIHLPFGNFKCGGYEPGYWKTLLAIGKVMDKVDSKGQTVNILGRSALEEHIPMPKLLVFLEGQGMPLRFLAPDSSLEDFISAGDARLNIVLSPFMQPLAQWMHKEHYIPFVNLHDAYSVEEINYSYMQMEQFLGLDIQKGFIEDIKEAKKIEKEAAKPLENIQYISANIGTVQPLPLTSYLLSLGMVPLMIHMPEFYPSDAQWREKIMVQESNPIICLMLNEQADKEIIEDLCPRIIIGDWGGRFQKNPPNVPILDLYGQIGYERTTTLLNRIIYTLDKEKEECEDGTV